MGELGTAWLWDCQARGLAAQHNRGSQWWGSLCPTRGAWLQPQAEQHQVCLSQAQPWNLVTSKVLGVRSSFVAGVGPGPEYWLPQAGGIPSLVHREGGSWEVLVSCLWTDSLGWASGDWWCHSHSAWGRLRPGQVV